MNVGDDKDPDENRVIDTLEQEGKEEEHQEHDCSDSNTEISSDSCDDDDRVRQEAFAKQFKEEQKLKKGGIWSWLQFGRKKVLPNKSHGHKDEDETDIDEADKVKTTINEVTYLPSDKIII